jgi:hypothetical protein
MFTVYPSQEKGTFPAYRTQQKANISKKGGYKGHINIHDIPSQHFSTNISLNFVSMIFRGRRSLSMLFIEFKLFRVGWPTFYETLPR